LILGPDAASQIPAITSTPQVVTFFSTFGTAAGPAPQTVVLTAPSGVTLTASASGGNWLTAALSGNSLTVSVNPAGLASADYDGTIQITAGSATAGIPVILHVIPPPPVLISYSPDPMPLAGPSIGIPGPITITGTGFQNGASAHVYVSAAGLPTSYIIAPGQVTVIDANTVQFYTGTGSSTPFAFAVTVSNPYSAESNALTIQIGSPSPQISAVQNAASGPQGVNLQPVSPGEMITITGVDFGSPFGISAPGSYTTPVTQLGDAQVFFDGVAVPLTYVSSSQINAVAPYSLAGKTSVNVTVQYLGVASAAATLAVVPSMVGLFTANSTGTGQAAIVNQDASTNSSSNPAALGSTVTFYATGMGPTNPQIPDNAVPQNTSVQPALPISAMIDNQPAKVVSAYAAPGMLGVLVINVQVPSSAHPGNAIPVVVQVGSSLSQQGITMATR
jgi:trimeric autotransporter adhesin